MPYPQSKVTSQAALKKIREYDNSTDWAPLDAGLYPIVAPENGYTVHADFAGIGEGVEGFVQAGFGITAATDIDPFAIAAYQKAMDREAVCTDLTTAPASYFRRADFYIASASCRAQTGASGRAHEKDQQEFWDQAVSLEEQRDRALMEEIVRKAANQLLVGKPCGYIVAENVIEVATKWRFFKRWVQEMNALGYHVQLFNFNTRFGHGQDTLAPAQSRDRLYIICTYRGDITKYRMPIPDLDKIRPPAWCWNEDKVTNARQFWKETDTTRGVERDMRVGEYGKQYIYCCEDCGKEVEPFSLSTDDHIDRSIPMVRNGDREELGLKPYKEATENRQYWGIAKTVLPMLAEGVGDDELDDHSFTFTFDSAGRDKRPRSAHEHSPTLTARAIDGVAKATSSVGFSVLNNGGGSKEAARLNVADPVNTLVSGGNHHIWGRYGDRASSQVPRRAPIVDLAESGVAVDGHEFIKKRAYKIRWIRETLKKYNFTPKDVSREMFLNTATRGIAPDEASSLQNERRGSVVYTRSRRVRFKGTGNANSVNVLKLIAEELLYTMHPEVRLNDRVPNLKRIFQNHRNELFRQIEAGKQHVSFGSDNSPSIVVPSQDMVGQITAEADKERQSVRIADRRAAAKLRRENGVVASPQTRTREVDLDKETGLADLSSLKRKPPRAQRTVDNDQMGLFEAPQRRGRPAPDLDLGM